MDKLDLLKSLRLLSAVPQDKLAALGDFLVPLSLPDGSVIFEEGAKGDGLYIISKGHVRISKKLPAKTDKRGAPQGEPAYKDLAILGPGNCFGEMSIMEEDVSRSAYAIASGDCVLLKLGRQDLHRWLQSDPVLAAAFFSSLVKVLADYLRRSSNEITLIYDLSQLLLEPYASARELLVSVLGRLVPHLEGDWCAGAYVYNGFNDEMELVVSQGDFASVPEKLRSVPVQGASAWLDERTYRVVFPGKIRPAGHFLFRRSSPLSAEEQNELARTLTTTARLITTAMENIAFRTEEGLRARLHASRAAGGGL